MPSAVEFLFVSGTLRRGAHPMHAVLAAGADYAGIAPSAARPTTSVW